MTDETNPPQEKKIFVDEDWKSRVEAEREALKQGEKKEPPDQADSAGSQTRAGREPPDDRPLPPPTLVDLAGSLAMQAMIAMGLVANPLTGKAEVRVHYARHLIDTLDLLQKKTEGNRTADETEALEHLLHELRLGFVEVQSAEAPQ